MGNLVRIILDGMILDVINWEFYSTDGMPNGYMLNCFPENKIWHDQLLLQKLKDL